MKNTPAKSVDEFIEAAIEVARPHLREVRAAIRSAIPEADEKIGYGKPFYKHNMWLTGLDVYKEHMGIEFWDGLSSDERADLEKKGYKTGSKTFQIRYDQPVPVAEIKRLARAQFDRDEAKAASKK